MTQRRNGAWPRRIAGALSAVALAAGLAGCTVFSGAEQIPSAPARRDVSRKELLQIVQDNMNRLATLTARADIQVIKQDILVPAGRIADIRRRAGKDYEKTYLRTEVNGGLLLSRPPHGPRKVRFSGVISGANAGFTLLGVGDEFWISMPNLERDRDNPDASRGVIYNGKTTPDEMRPRDKLSVRPQDVCDLLLQDEVYDIIQGKPETLCYCETWPDFYVLNFLRLDWPEHVFAKIWVERKNLRVAIHQIYDRSGVIVAEGRFRNYVASKSHQGAIVVDVPTEIMFIWPRDHLVMEAQLSGIKVNMGIADRNWEPRIGRGYEVVPLTIPDKDALRP